MQFEIVRAIFHRVFPGRHGRLPVLIAAPLVLLAVETGAQYSPALQIDNEVNTFILRCAARHRLQLPESFYFQPLHAADVLRFLDTLDSLGAAGRLTEQEALWSRRLHVLVAGKPNFMTLQHPDRPLESHMNMSFLGMLEPEYDGDASVRMQGTLEPIMTGRVGRLSYYSQVDVWTEVDSDSMYVGSEYQPFEGVAYNLYGRADTSSNPAIRSSDMLRAGISLTTRYIDFVTAIDYLRCGPARLYPLTLSGHAPPVTYFLARMNLAFADYFHTFGLLRAQKNRDKYFNAHRLEFNLRKWFLTAGINEVVVYGSTAELAQNDSLRPEYYCEKRHLEWLYMIPFVPYAFAEHYGGDRDNITMSFDVSLMYPKGFRWYCEFFLDDMTTPVTIFSDDWGNKWALTAGGEYFSTLFGRDLHALLEYCRVEPWVYTHFYGGSHNYAHFGQSLGAPIGPDAAAVECRADLALTANHTVGIVLRNVRRNTAARGSSLTDVFQRGKEPDTKEFLGPGTTRDNVAGISWTYCPYSIFTMRALLEYDTDGAVGVKAWGRFIF